MNPLNVSFKMLHKNSVLPRYAKHGDAGLDCFAVSNPIVTDTYVAYNLGFAVEIPEGYVGLLFPRSSVSKKDLVMANSVGVIDSGYRGEVQARFKITGRSFLTSETYEKGEAICQLMIVPYPQIQPVWVDELSETERGDGGWGHTNK